MKWINFNINDKIRVKLTLFGYQIYKEHAESFDQYGCNMSRIPPIDNDGWWEEQCWSIMSIFGKHLHNGGNVPFETDIMVERK